MSGLSVAIICKNEEASISRCLDSVGWADEIVVVDSGSTDATVEICRRHRARVIVTDDWPGFGPQKNRALAQCSKDWVLSLDADEWLTPELADEIRAAMGSPGARVAFKIPRRSSFCGRFMEHSGWSPDYVVRLFRRESGRFSDDTVHERVLVQGNTGSLKNPLLHETYRDLEELLRKMDHYSTAGAQMMRSRGARASLSGAVGHALWAFLRTYFLRAGVLDGREGFMLAVANAEGTYYRYLKLMLLNKS